MAARRVKAGPNAFHRPVTYGLPPDAFLFRLDEYPDSLTRLVMERKHA